MTVSKAFKPTTPILRVPYSVPAKVSYKALGWEKMGNNLVEIGKISLWAAVLTAPFLSTMSLFNRISYNPYLYQNPSRYTDIPVMLGITSQLFFFAGNECLKKAIYHLKPSEAPLL